VPEVKSARKVSLGGEQFRDESDYVVLRSPSLTLRSITRPGPFSSKYIYNFKPDTPGSSSRRSNGEFKRYLLEDLSITAEHLDIVRIKANPYSGQHG